MSLVSCSGSTWSQQAYLKASNTDAYDFFGGAGLSLSGDTLAVGAQAESSSPIGVNRNQTGNSAGQSGAVYVFDTLHQVFLPLVMR